MIAPDDGAPEATSDELAETSEALATSTADPGWAELLQYLHVARGFDFQGYKPTTLARRVRKRMSMRGIESYDAYQEYIELHQDEFGELFNTILINVTNFFRDPESWEALRTTAIAPLLAAKSNSEPIRAWSAGCASGEEAYSIAMVLAEEMGVEQFRERVKIYGTDVDEDALNVARHATYTDKQLENVSSELREKYFQQVDGLYAFRKDLRRQVIFGRHDLISDAPISRVDLLVCRNTLMYFNAETQARILARFHFALVDSGYLFLGRAETLMAQGQMFVPVDLKRRISRKRSRGTPRDGLPDRPGSGDRRRPCRDPLAPERRRHRGQPGGPGGPRPGRPCRHHQRAGSISLRSPCRTTSAGRSAIFSFPTVRSSSGRSSSGRRSSNGRSV